MIFEYFVGPNRPLSWTFQFWPVLVISFVFGVLATWFCKKIALKYGIVDKPNDTVKTHKEPIAYLGGVGIFVGLAAGILAGVWCFNGDAGVPRWLMGILTGSAIACFVGLVDDVYDLRPSHKIIGQIIASIPLIAAGAMPMLNPFLRPFGLSIPDSVEWAIGVPIVIFTVLGATNSLNLLDGLDGLCAGVTAIITIALLFLAVHLATWGWSEVRDPVRLIVCLSLVGGVCGFLPYNRNPAKIFMGDAGSMLLGFVVAAIMMLFARAYPRWWAASIVVFGLPILDTAVALARRWLNKRPLFVSDRGHIYDQMIDRGLSLKKTVKVCYVLAAVYAFIGLAMSQIRTRHAIIIYIIVFIASAFVVWKMGFLKMEGLRGAVKKENAEKDGADA
ncbi:MAG: MraY family glycosyltransferase [Phycisphaerae bacterium]|jgi:UDP-GlcNAc:undecaprenyl-phosphate GlcNAc-1-phosphate transferase